jgi:DNA-binding transcriptional LysR family regulator
MSDSFNTLAEHARVLYSADVFQQMTTFIRIVDAGNISRAARSLGLSVAMASRHLRWLEDELGAPLLRRTTRRIDLTEAGLEFAPRVRAILAGVDEAKAVVRRGRGVAGRVVLSVPPTLGVRRIAPLLPALLNQHPRLRVEIRFEDRAIDLIKDGVDIAVRAGRPLPDSPFIVGRKIASFERVVCASPKFLAAHGPIDAVAKLAKLPCIVHGTPPTVWEFETPNGPESVHIDGHLRTNHLLAIREAVVAGMGVAWLPSWLVKPDILARRVKPVPVGMKLSSLDVYAIFHAQSRGATAMRAVLDYLAAELPASLAK